MDNNYFGSNLKYLRGKFDVEQQELADELGRKSGSTISDWERGKATPNAGTLAYIAERFKVSLFQLMNTDLTLPRNLQKITGKTIPVPVIGRISAGDPILADEHIIEYREVPENDLRGDEFFLIADGNSMYPTIPNNSYVLVRVQPDVESGEIAAVLLNGDEDATLKRVKKQGDIVMLLPDNKEYDPIIVSEENPARIIGKAIKISIDL